MWNNAFVGFEIYMERHMKTKNALSPIFQRFYDIGIILFIFGLVFPLAGCSDDEGDIFDGPPTVSVTGKWTGSSTDAQGSIRWKSYITLNLVQQASGAVTGTAKASSEEPASGLVAGNHLSLTVDYGNGFTGTYNLDVDGNTMSGTYAEAHWSNGKHKDVIVQRVSQ